MAKVAFKQCDVERILRAGKKAGTPLSVRMSTKTGDIFFDPVDAAKAPPEASEPDFWESYNADQGRA